MEDLIKLIGICPVHMEHGDPSNDESSDDESNDEKANTSTEVAWLPI